MPSTTSFPPKSPPIGDEGEHETKNKGETLCLEGFELVNRTDINNMLSLKKLEAHRDAKSPTAWGTSLEGYIIYI